MSATSISGEHPYFDRVRKKIETNLDSNLSLDQLAEESGYGCISFVSCGFASQSHMTSVFRQRLETTPGQFRRKA
jgi:AraC-like DNA-binding protein